MVVSTARFVARFAWVIFLFVLSAAVSLSIIGGVLYFAWPYLILVFDWMSSLVYTIVSTLVP